jgi:hypothetical protein
MFSKIIGYKYKVIAIALVLVSGQAFAMGCLINGHSMQECDSICKDNFFFPFPCL